MPNNPFKIIIFNKRKREEDNGFNLNIYKKEIWKKKLFCNYILYFLLCG